MTDKPPKRRKLYVSKATKAHLVSIKRQKWRKSRMKQQGDLCFYCKRRMREDVSGLKPTLDHYVPLAIGGEDHYENTVAACYSCNNAKQSTHGDEFSPPKPRWAKADGVIPS